MANGGNGASGNGLVHSATGAAGALAGWAIASLGKQLPVSEVHTTLSATPTQVQQPLSAQRSSSDIFQSNGQSGSTIPSRSATPSQATRLPPARKAGGMQLGGSASHARQAGNAAGSTSLVDTLAGEFEEDGDEVANAWGSNDLMDVNADGDDWSESMSYSCCSS
jgi:SCY1-like protein 1